MKTPRTDQPDAETLTARYWHARGVYDGCQKAFQVSPSDDTAKLRNIAVMRLAAAQKALLGEVS
jgi:hypothetical protein